MGFDRSQKTFSDSFFLISLAFFVESCICDGLTRALSQSHINESSDRCELEQSMTWGLACLKESCIYDSFTITVS